MRTYLVRKPVALALGLLMGALQAQTTVIRDSIEMGAGYANVVYYSLQNGPVGTAPTAGWHLAFEMPIRGAAIRINSARGVVVWSTTKDTSGWATLSLADTVERLYDDLCRWEIGALNYGAAPGDPFDVGWGQYDLITHITIGKALFILGLPNGSQKKLWIKKLQGPQYTVQLANLDGTQDTTFVVDKSVATGRNFVYLKLIPQVEVLSLEPATTSWDLVFTPYTAILSGNTPYPVTGVLQNVGVHAARVRLTSQANPDTLTPSAYPLDSCISTVGYDWKRFDMSSNSWVLADTLYFLVRDKAGALWRLRFVGFTGSSTGKAFLEKVRLQAPTALAHGPGRSLKVYPQPAQEGLWVELPQAGPYELQLYALSGQEVWRERTQAGELLYLPRPAYLPAGLYLLQVTGRTGLWSQIVTFD